MFKSLVENFITKNYDISYFIITSVSTYQLNSYNFSFFLTMHKN